MKRRLVFIAIVVLIAILFSSCSSDDSFARQSENGITFELQSNEKLSLISIRINDSEGNTINSYSYQDKVNLSLNIVDGSTIIVYVVDEDELYYDYSINNNNGSVQTNGFVEDAFNHTLIKSYVIQ